MSARASAYAKGLLECPNGELISAREKLVLMVLADSHQDRAGRYTYPSIQTIAKDAMCDRRSCQRYLAALERKEVILRMHPANQGRAQITYYFFTELDEVPKGWQPAALSDDGFFLQKGGRRAVERAAKGRQNAPSLNRTRAGEPEPEQEQEQKQLPLIPLAGEGEANGGTREEAGRGFDENGLGLRGCVVALPDTARAGVCAAGGDSAVPATQKVECGTSSATGPADLAQVADEGSAVEPEQDVGDFVWPRRDADCASGPDCEQHAGSAPVVREAPQAAGADEAKDVVLAGRAGPRWDMGDSQAPKGSQVESVELGCDQALAGNCGGGGAHGEFSQEQLEHLARVKPQDRAMWVAYYREENAMAAAAAKQEQKPEEPELEFADVAAARAWVMRELGFLERRRGGMGPVVGAALRARVEQGEALGILVKRMVGAIRKHAEFADRMRYQYGPAKFISLGLWLDESKWPWDYAEIRRRARMSF